MFAGIGALIGAVLMGRATTPVVGVLEQPPQCSRTRPVGLRPLFARRGDSWTALLTQDSLRSLELGARQFTLAFDGRSLGTLNTSDPGFQGDTDWFTRDHFLDIEPGQRLPRVANRSHRFEGWCDAPAVRPIVAVTSDHYEDPESWKPFQPSPALRDSLFPAFRTVVGDATVCRKRKEPGRTDSTEHDVAYPYTARDLVVIAAYRNVRGREIVGLEISESIRPCDYFMDPQVLGHWFLVGATPTLLGDNMDLVDAGDYDGDGKSELLFWTSGDDRDSYVLMYDDFAKRSEFYWNYH